MTITQVDTCGQARRDAASALQQEREREFFLFERAAVNSQRRWQAEITGLLEHLAGPAPVDTFAEETPEEAIVLDSMLAPPELLDPELVPIDWMEFRHSLRHLSVAEIDKAWDAQIVKRLNHPQRLAVLQFRAGWIAEATRLETGLHHKKGDPTYDEALSAAKRRVAAKTRQMGWT